MPVETRSQRQAYGLRPSYPQVMTNQTSQTSTSSSAFQSSNSLSSVASASSGTQQLSLPAQHYSSAPMPSPSAGPHAPHYFGSTSQQATASQHRLPSSAHVGGQKSGQESLPATTPFLQDFSLVAEAAKRAQVACLVDSVDHICFEGRLPWFFWRIDEDFAMSWQVE
nr:hypothetical protein CFP56_32402 [Quercus suber]